MAKDERQKLRDKTVQDLNKSLREEQQRLQELRFDLARGKVKNSALTRDAKKNIARINTILKEKEQGEKEIKQNEGK